MKKTQLFSLSTIEMKNINGGNEAGRGFWFWLGQQVVENWDHIKAGAADGWNGTYNPR